jgi:anti-anti-sigma regulatory factor
MHTQLLATFDPPVARLRLVGGFCIGSGEILERRIDDLLRLGCTWVEVDGRRVTSIDRRCLQVLTGARSRLAANGCLLTIVAASPGLLRAAMAGGFSALVDDVTAGPDVRLPSAEGPSW